MCSKTFWQSRTRTLKRHCIFKSLITTTIDKIQCYSCSVISEFPFLEFKSPFLSLPASISHALSWNQHLSPSISQSPNFEMHNIFIIWKINYRGPKMIGMPRICRFLVFFKWVWKNGCSESTRKAPKEICSFSILLGWPKNLFEFFLTSYRKTQINFFTNTIKTSVSYCYVNGLGAGYSRHK